MRKLHKFACRGRENKIDQFDQPRNKSLLASNKMVFYFNVSEKYHPHCESIFCKIRGHPNDVKKYLSFKGLKIVIRTRLVIYKPIGID